MLLIPRAPKRHGVLPHALQPIFLVNRVLGILMALDRQIDEQPQQSAMQFSGLAITIFPSSPILKTLLRQ